MEIEAPMTDIVKTLTEGASNKTGADDEMSQVPTTQELS